MVLHHLSRRQGSIRNDILTRFTKKGLFADPQLEQKTKNEIIDAKDAVSILT